MHANATLWMTIALLASGCATAPASNPDPVSGTDRAATAGADPAFAPVAWLAGGWSGVDARGVLTEEHWIPPAGGTMFGVNRVIAGGRTVFFENLRIERDADGTLVYLASPEGRQPPTPFRMSSSGPGEVVFENPDHDYPQRIAYRHEAPARLIMRISGTENGVEKRGQWVMERATPEH